MSASAVSTVPGLARKVRKVRAARLHSGPSMLCRPGTMSPPFRALQVLDIRTEAPDILDSLAALSRVYQDNSTASRRQLRANIEGRGINNLQQFLSAAQAVIGVRCCINFHTACSIPHHYLQCYSGIGTGRCTG